MHNELTRDQEIRDEYKKALVKTLGEEDKKFEDQAVEIEVASPDRVPAPCAWARSPARATRER